MYCTFVQPSLDAGNSFKCILGIFKDGALLVTHFQILSTFKDGGQVKFPTLGMVVDVKIPILVCLTKSNSPKAPRPAFNCRSFLSIISQFSFALDCTPVSHMFPVWQHTTIERPLFAIS